MEYFLDRDDRHIAHLSVRVAPSEDQAKKRQGHVHNTTHHRMVSFNAGPASYARSLDLY